MKTVYIILLLLGTFLKVYYETSNLGFSICLAFGVYSTSNAQISETVCPEMDSAIIFVLHGMLTHPNLQSARQQSGLSNHKVEMDSETLRKKSNLHEFIVLYSKDRDVVQVTD